ncbi:uncharacterized protein LOC122542912 isoform X2 [Chiloscyllium plagiosum]|uniref:uncharacterized protein LOC122542912 isoform X2 n=1 Tax=Chiloscyllium plagiosum TaxID=36176 RepID=UPI001CB7F6BE|nr:uncharacterized protein LOC122542912 isoform X2 [Chiloscyllium plagiosum]
MFFLLRKPLIVRQQKSEHLSQFHIILIHFRTQLLFSKACHIRDVISSWHVATFTDAFNNRLRIFYISSLVRQHTGLPRKMEINLLFCAFALLMFRHCRCVSVSQIPRELTVRREDTAALTCQQEDSDYITMLWYRQSGGQGLQLVAVDVSGNKPTFERGFEKGFDVVRRNLKTSILKILSVNPGDTAMYFCAASEHRGAKLTLEMGRSWSFSKVLSRNPASLFFNPLQKKLIRSRRRQWFASYLTSIQTMSRSPGSSIMRFSRPMT